jgi:hypothetical protein
VRSEVRKVVRLGGCWMGWMDSDSGGEMRPGGGLCV